MRRAILILAMLLAGCYEDRMREEYVQAGCIPTFKEEMQERRYCGKACMRPVIREHFRCPLKDGKTFDTYFEY